MKWPWGQRPERYSQVWPDRFQQNGRRMPRCFVDRRGKKYSFAVRAVNSDWWIGATILMNHEQVEKGDGGVPLIEVDPETGEPLGNGEPDDRYPHVTCPLCRFTSYNKNDIEQKYCGRCHWWTSDELLMQVWWL